MWCPQPLPSLTHSLIAEYHRQQLAPSGSALQRSQATSVVPMYNVDRLRHDVVFLRQVSQVSVLQYDIPLTVCLRRFRRSLKVLHLGGCHLVTGTCSHSQARDVNSEQMLDLSICSIAHRHRSPLLATAPRRNTTWQSWLPGPWWTLQLPVL